ncbi:MAG TPA: acyl-CoA synthetase FdrA [Casimicrobiaceae bacterium]|nr:acyl-CoA synthetase FdrA [Casimicrobiaceae bacterium]
MSTLVNHVRRAFYRDSVALMRISRAIAALDGVEAAALMIGSATNRKLMHDAGLLAADGQSAGPNDLVLAVRANTQASAQAALNEAARLLEAPAAGDKGGDEWMPKSLDTALARLPSANLALISVPGDFAAAEARRALRRGLHVMIFSDNVAIDDEVELKREAKERGLLMMGPDCGTAIIGGVPLAFANVIPRGDIGIVGASGTGTQEVSTLIARLGRGVSHAIGVGGRDLKEAVGGITTLMAIDALDRDPGTRQLVLISKPPAAAVAKVVLEKIAQVKKPVSICFVGADDMPMPANAALFSDLRSCVEHALGGKRIGWMNGAPDPEALAARVPRSRTRLRGLFSGGTLCAEAQVILRRAGLAVASNVPVPGVAEPAAAPDAHVVLDLGDDEYTVGRPHPMIDPTIRNQMLSAVLRDGKTAIVLLDIVIGYGAHADPAGDLIATLRPAKEREALLIASVCGTEDDPQRYSRQVALLEEAGIVVAPSNADAAELAVDVLRALA